jgi:hypothetical protein
MALIRTSPLELITGPSWMATSLRTSSSRPGSLSTFKAARQAQRGRVVLALNGSNCILQWRLLSSRSQLSADVGQRLRGCPSIAAEYEASPQQKFPLTPAIAVCVHDALNLAIAPETSEYLPLVSAIEVVWTTSAQGSGPAAICAQRFVIHAKASRFL